MTKVTYDEFSKLDMRVGKIVDVQKIEGKSRIVKGLVDIGSEKRQVIVGGAQYYNAEDLVGKTVVVVTNLEPQKIAGIESSAMLLAADVDGKPVWLSVENESEVPLGTVIR